MRKGTPIIVLGLLGWASWGLTPPAGAQQPYYMPPRPPMPYYPPMPPPPYMGPGPMGPVPMMGPGPMGPGPMMGPMGPAPGQMQMNGPPPMPGYGPMGPPPYNPYGPYGPPPQQQMGPYGPMPFTPQPNPGMVPGSPGFPNPYLNQNPGQGQDGFDGHGQPQITPALPLQEGEPPLQQPLRGQPAFAPLAPEPIPEGTPVEPEQNLHPGCPDGSCSQGHGHHGHGHHGHVFPGWHTHEEEPVHGHPFHACCDFFPKGSYTFQVMGGYYSNSSLFKTGAPTYTFAPINLRFGKLCCCDCCHGLLRGSLEPIFEINGAPVLDGPGRVFVGSSFILRYNFVQPCCRVIPYIQVGAGAQYNDAYKDTTQTMLGQALEFSASGQVGLRFFLKPNLSLDVEGGYIHLSNFNQSSRNDGVNALGGSAGLTFYFPAYKSYRY